MTSPPEQLEAFRASIDNLDAVLLRVPCWRAHLRPAWEPAS